MSDYYYFRILIWLLALIPLVIVSINGFDFTNVAIGIGAGILNLWIENIC